MTTNIPELRKIISYKKTFLIFHIKSSKLIGDGISYFDKNIFIAKKFGKNVRKTLHKNFDENKINDLGFRDYSDLFYSRKR